MSAPEGAPSVTGIKGIIRKVPMPVWLAAGGITVGVAYASWRDRNTPDVTEVSEDAIAGTYADPYEVSYGASVPTPGVTIDPQYTDPGEAYAAVFQTALETISNQQTEFTNTMLEFLNRQPAPTLPANEPPPPAAPAVPGPPQQTPPPSAAPKATRPPHYKAGSTAKNGAGTVSLTVPGATGWAQLEDKSAQFALFHFSFANGKLERWRKWGTGNHVPKDKRGKAVKEWVGTWG